MTKTLKFPVLAVCCLVAISAAVSCTNETRSYYVSPSGSDDADGLSEAASLQTLAEAKARVAEAKRKGYEGAVEVIVGAGTYYLDEPLVFTPAESGNPDAPYTIRAAEEGQVWLSGGVPLNLHWTEHVGGVWKADVEPAIERIGALYLDDRTLVRARYPNRQNGVYPYGGYAADALAPERIARWHNPAGGYIHAMHSGRWGGMHYRITGKNTDGTLAYEGGWQNNRPSPMHPSQRMVENIREELDAPGEWFFDADSNALYYMPEQGRLPNDLTFVASRLESVVELKGTAETPVTDIRFEGLSFAHTEPTFMDTREQLMRSDWSIYRMGAVLLAGTERCAVRNGTFRQLGGNAVFVSDYNRDAVVADNLIEDIGGSAIAFVGSADAVRSPSFRYEEFVPAAQMDTVVGPQREDYPADCIAQGNLIRYIGTIEKQVAGVQIQLAARIQVLHNTIYHVPRAGINIGDGAWGGHLLAHNDVFETVLETGDHGAFNSWGRDRFWHPDRAVMDSLVARHPEWILLDAVETTVIRDNRFRCDHGWDIDLDDGSSNYAIYNNLCLNGGLKLREGFYRKVYNNILVNNGFHPHVWFENSGDVFRNNVVMAAHQPIGIKHWGDTVDYNHFVSEADLRKSQDSGIESHADWGDPKFADPAAADFTLAGDAKAIAGGFKNFDMKNFGVTAGRLKQLADKPEIPPLLLADTNQLAKEEAWLGGRVKPVETLGEQSAAGLGDIKGVVLVAVPEGSLLAASGLKEGDVVLAVDGLDVNTVVELRKAEAANRWKQRLELSVWRNQGRQEVVLSLE